MEKVLVSACLLGNKVRYNGSNLSIHAEMVNWLNEHVEIIPCCPEVSAGLPIPRAPAEIQFGQGIDVIHHQAKVMGNDGIDVTSQFIQGAQNALSLCQTQGIRFAVLAESSPSCGSNTIYNGAFRGVKIPGQGVTAALLEHNGIHVFSQHTLPELKALLSEMT
jgi:uncharacterized protein YbbK (DUF523 family)